MSRRRACLKLHAIRTNPLHPSSERNDSSSNLSCFSKGLSMEHIIRRNSFKIGRSRGTGRRFHSGAGRAVAVTLPRCHKLKVTDIAGPPFETDWPGAPKIALREKREHPRNGEDHLQGAERDSGEIHRSGHAVSPTEIPVFLVLFFIMNYSARPPYESSGAQTRERCDREPSGS